MKARHNISIFFKQVNIHLCQQAHPCQYLSPEESPSGTVLPMLDRRWSIFGTGSMSLWSSGVCRKNINI